MPGQSADVMHCRTGDDGAQEKARHKARVFKLGEAGKTLSNSLGAFRADAVNHFQSAAGNEFPEIVK